MSKKTKLLSKKYKVLSFNKEGVEKNNILVQIEEVEKSTGSRQVSLNALDSALRDLKNAKEYHKTKIEEVEKSIKIIKKERDKVEEEINKVVVPKK
jgi:chromosome segregation ATPase